VRPALVFAIAFAHLASCNPPGAAPTAKHPSAPTTSSAPPAEPPPTLEDPRDALTWAPETRSPRPSGASGIEARLAGLCSEADGGLETVARRIAERTLADRPVLDPGQLNTELRAAGSPYVWPRSWMLSGAQIDPADAEERVKRFLASFGDGGKRVCGAAEVISDKKRAVALVAVDALAELRPLPSKSHAGKWLAVEAQALGPVDRAKVVVLGPRGAPHELPTSTSGGIVRARFAPNAPGTWLVQVVAVVSTGPRPVLEALVHADVEPPITYQARRAPGEESVPPDGDPVEAIARMINNARASEGVSKLTRDARLDKVALEHAEAMLKARSLGHDVGDGMVKDRVEAIGLSPRVIGENVARAETPERAHRAIWASPSHRGNLLEPRYDSMGVGAVRGPDGLWVCEVFADFR
jgi:uncharacterized protein YkwD